MWEALDADPHGYNSPSNPIIPGNDPLISSSDSEVAPVEEQIVQPEISSEDAEIEQTVAPAFEEEDLPNEEEGMPSRPAINPHCDSSLPVVSSSPLPYEEAITSALAHPAPLVWQDGAWVVGDAPPPRVIATQIPASGRHDYPVDYPSREEVKLMQGPHEVVVDSLPDLRGAVMAYGHIAHVPINSVRLNDGLQHEGEHDEVTGLLGGTSLYALRVLANGDLSVMGWQLTHLPADLHTNKVGRALLAAYPNEPSPEDMDIIRSLGYKSIGRVGRVAAWHGLPLPLSLIR